MKLRLIILQVFIFCFCTASKAQYGDQPMLKVGIDFSLGTTAKSSPFGYALGIDLLLNYKLSDQLTVLASAGYGSLLTKDTSPIADYNFVPLRATVKVFPFMENIYLSGIIGAGFGVLKGSKTALIYGGQAGYEWNSGYDLGIKYEGYQQSMSSTTYQPRNGQFALVFTYHF